MEKEYIRAGNEGMVSPLTRFLDGEMRNIMRERKILENKRLDLDACKNRVRKARGMLDQPPVRNSPVDKQTMHKVSTWKQILLKLS